MGKVVLIVKAMRFCTYSSAWKAIFQAYAASVKRESHFYKWNVLS